MEVRKQKMNTNIKQTNTQSKEIAIAQLPLSCFMRERVKSWVNDIHKATVYVVAKTDNLDNWVCYIGYPHMNMILDNLKHSPFIQYHCTHMQSESQVLAYGDVLDKESAELLFPEWNYRRYRT